MANSRIVIDFLAVPGVNQFLNINESKLGLNINFVFKNTRNGVGIVAIPKYVAGHGYNTYISNNYRDAFNLDFNAANLFTITSTIGSYLSGIGSVTIEANYPDADFVENGKTISASLAIYNETGATPINFDSYTFSAATTPNTHARVNITTSVLATAVNSPVVIDPNTNNPFYVDVLRGSTNIFEVENAEGSIASMSIIAPKVLDVNNFNVNVSSSPNGGTVTIEEKVYSALTLQYSIDNVDYQTQNTFIGLLSGDYTLYIQDSIGGTAEIPFTVSEFGIYTPYFYISKSNSIRFANRITWGDAANYKNDENTLGAEVDVDLAYNGCQNFKSANVITTQFKSNYQNNVVKIIKEDLSEVNVPVVKKSSNIGIKDKRDGYKYYLGDGKIGIAFLSGNIYDFDTGVVTGTHSMAGTLPEWGVVGSYINIDSAWFIIEETYYDEEKGADILVYSGEYTGKVPIGAVEGPAVVGSIYNDFNFEIFEFTIDMVDYLNQTIQVRINATDSHFESVEHLSEKIDVAINFDKNVEIYYWNDDNTDVFYATGIRHLINVELTKQEGVTEEESETNKTDTTAILLSAQLYELDKFIFEPVSKEIWRKMMIALSHKNVFINGVQYVKSGNFDTEGPLDQSNLYVLKATMLKTGIVYNADSADGADFNTGSIEIPGLIQTEIGFVKY